MGPDQQGRKSLSQCRTQVQRTSQRWKIGLKEASRGGMSDSKSRGLPVDEKSLWKKTENKRTSRDRGRL